MSETRSTRRLGAAVMIAATGLAMTGCALRGTVCSAIGYSSVAEVTLAQPREGLTLQLCDGAACEPQPAAAPEEIGQSDIAPVDADRVDLEGDSADGWTADFIGGQRTIGYRLTDSNGATVAEGTTSVEWIRVGGTEECGGPREATIELPA